MSDLIARGPRFDTRRPLTFVSHSADSRRVTGESKCTLVLVNCLEGLGLPMNSVVTLTDRPHITLDVKQQNSNNQERHVSADVLCNSENNVVSTTTVLRRCFSGSVANG